jgi:hypothetical protein
MSDRWQTQGVWHPLDIIDVNLSLVAELESEFAFVVSKGIRLVDLGVFWQLSVRLH